MDFSLELELKLAQWIGQECVSVSVSPVQVTDEGGQRGPVDPRKTSDDLFVAVQPLSPRRGF